jgi:MFS family permease
METEEPASAGPSPTSLFRNRNFKLFFVGQLVSNTGNWLQLAAQNALVLQLTGSSFMVGMATAALFLPVFVFALPGGQLADRFDRRKLLIATQVMAMVATGALAVLAATGHSTVTAVMVAALVVGVQYALSIPTMMALLPSLVEPGQLGLAIGMNSITYNIARILGPAVATALVVGVGFGMAFALNSLSFVVLIVALMKMRPRETAASSEEAGSIREALSYAWNNKRMRLVLIGVATVPIAMDPVITLGPTFATSLFGADSAAKAGYLVSAFGLGAIVATFVATKGFRKHGTARFELLAPWSIVFAAGMLVFAFAPSIVVAVPALMVAGAAFLVVSTNWTAGLQEMSPEHMRGRIMAIWTLCSIGVRPFAAVIDGAIADLVSPEAAVIVMLIPLIVVGVFASRTLRPVEASA